MTTTTTPSAVRRRSGLSAHHLVALIGALLTSSIALGDAVIHGTTGHSSVFADDSGRPGWIVAGDLIHGLTYAALVLVLVRERWRFASTNRTARIVRRVLIASLVVLAVGFVLVAPVLVLADVSLDGVAGVVWGAVASAAFAGMILSSLVLGLATLRTTALGLGARILAAIGPVLLLTVLLAFVAPGWAHPGYVETMINVGVALLGVLATVRGADRECAEL